MVSHIDSNIPTNTSFFMMISISVTKTVRFNIPLKLSISGLVILNSVDFFSHRLDTIKPPFSWRLVVTTPRLGLPCKCRISGLVNLMQVDVIILYADIKGTSSFKILKIKCFNHERIFSIDFKSTSFHSKVLRVVKCNMQSKAIAQRGW